MESKSFHITPDIIVNNDEEFETLNGDKIIEDMIVSEIHKTSHTFLNTKKKYLTFQIFSLITTVILILILVIICLYQTNENKNNIKLLLVKLDSCPACIKIEEFLKFLKGAYKEEYHIEIININDIYKSFYETQGEAEGPRRPEQSEEKKVIGEKYKKYLTMTSRFPSLFMFDENLQKYKRLDHFKLIENFS